jgi:hypothetical protein
MKRKIKLLTIQLASAVFTLIVVLVSGFFIFGPDFVDVVKAVTGNYNKATGNQLTIADWNNLDNDFLDKQNPAGDTMAGPLNMNNQRITNLAEPSGAGDAATRQYVLDTLNDFSFTNINGNPMKVVCGQTTPGSTNWQQTTGVNDVVWLDVDTTAAGFTGSVPPMYFTNLSGNTQLFRTYGVTSVYTPTNTTFRVYVVYAPGVLTPAQANTWGWHLKWCGFASN